LLSKESDKVEGSTPTTSTFHSETSLGKGTVMDDDPFQGEIPYHTGTPESLLLPKRRQGTLIQ